MTQKQESIIKIIEKSFRTLRSAKNAFKDRDFETASSRAYYAVFHIMQAILLTRDLTFSKHSGVISAFSQYFIKPGIFPREFSKCIRQLLMDREIGDYSYYKSIDKDKAGADIAIAQEIVAKAHEYLGKWFKKNERGKKEAG